MAVYISNLQKVVLCIDAFFSRVFLVLIFVVEMSYMNINIYIYMNIVSSTDEISKCKKHTILRQLWLYLDNKGTITYKQ